MQREYRNALQVILAGIDKLNQTTLTGQLPRAAVHQDAMMMWDGKIKSCQMPGTAEWRWNQSKGRQQMQLADGVQAEVTKLIPRSRSRDGIKAPSYKIWICEFTSSITPVHSVTWCERGIVTKTPQPQIRELELRIEDYAFLSPFMSSSVAAELWPSLSQNQSDQSPKDQSPKLNSTPPSPQEEEMSCGSVFDQAFESIFSFNTTNFLFNSSNSVSY